MNEILINDSFGLITVLIIIPMLIFITNDHPKYGKLFQYVPSLLFAYFIPTVLSNFSIFPGINFDVIPKEAPIYKEIKNIILPASLLLLTLSVDIKGIIKLGPKAVIMFLTATLGIVIGAAVSLLIWKELLPTDIWRGMAALSGSWIGGGANFIAVGENFATSDEMMSGMVIVDVFTAQFWTGLLFYLAARYLSIDKKFNADNSAIETLKEKVIAFQEKTTRISSTVDIFVILSLAFGFTYLSILLSKVLPPIGENGSIINAGTWKVILVTSFGVFLSFTKLRNYEGAGASKFGTVMLYMLIGVIGANADILQVIKEPYMILMGFTWLAIHGLILFIMMKLIKAPLFFMAVGSQANVGGAASAPIVASAFHPSLATVGVMLGTAGYVLGTYVAILCGYLLQWIYHWR